MLAETNFAPLYIQQLPTPMRISPQLEDERVSELSPPPMVADVRWAEQDFAPQNPIIAAWS